MGSGSPATRIPSVEETLTRLDIDPDREQTGEEAARRPFRYGENAVEEKRVGRLRRASSSGSRRQAGKARPGHRG